MNDLGLNFALFVLSSEGFILSTNRESDLESLVSKHFSVLYTEEAIRNEEPQLHLDLGKRQGHCDAEGWRVQLDGIRFWARSCLFQLHHAYQQGPSQFLLLLHDLSKERTRELQREAMEKGMSEMKDYALLLLDKAGNIREWNEGARFIYGYEYEDVVGRHASLLYPSDLADLGVTSNNLSEALKNGRFEEENWRRKKDGTLFWASVVVNPIFDNHDLVGFFAITQDITESIRLKEEARKAVVQAEIQMTKHKEAQLRHDQLHEFADHICHEIRNPLQGMIGNTELLQQIILRIEAILKAIPDPDIHSRCHTELESISEGLSAMKECVDHQTTIVDRVHRLSDPQLHLSYSSPKYERFDLGKMVRTVVLMFRASAVVKQTNVVIDCPPTLEVVGDPEHIKDILITLIKNAIKYTPCGTVYVQVNLKDPLVIVVQDTGHGMTEEKRQTVEEQLLTKAYQPRSASGLSYCKRLLDAMGGKISFESTKGKGTKFEISLPERKEWNPTVPSAAQEEKPSTESACSLLFPRERDCTKVLVVEDNPLCQRVLIHHLTVLGCNVESASNGKEAVKILETRHNDFNLVLMDLCMPEMNGLEACRALRQHEIAKELPTLPVVAISGNCSEPDRKECLEAGMNGLIRKPVLNTDLARIVHNTTDVVKQER